MLTALLVYFAVTIVFYLYSFAQFEYMVNALKQVPELHREAGQPQDSDIMFAHPYFGWTLLRFLWRHKTKPEPLPMPPGEYRRIRLLVLTAAAEFYAGFFLLLTCGHLIATLD